MTKTKTGTKYIVEVQLREDPSTHEQEETAFANLNPSLCKLNLFPPGPKMYRIIEYLYPE